MEEKHPKILICTVGSWSTRNGSDTIPSLVQGIPSEQLACLYIRADKANSPICSKYYHIYEHRVVKSVFFRSLKTGESFSPSGDLGEETDNAEYQDELRRYKLYRRVRSWWFILIREILWKCGVWHTKELDSFLEDFSPDIVFFPIEGYIHFNRINEYIIQKCHPSRVLGYMWDDNFTYKQHPYNLPYKIHRYWLRKGVGRIIRQCDVIFAITPKLKKELDSTYGVNSVLLTKPLRSLTSFCYREPQKPIRIIYTGKLVLGRDRTIADIVEALQIVNNGDNTIYLDVFSDTYLPQSIKKRIDIPGICNLRGFIPQQQVLQEQKEADVLLFVESLSNRDLSARLSFSTKITDYLSAGKCIWAVGNKDLAPLSYLEEEDAAVVSTSKDTIIQRLRQIVDDKETIPTYARKAYECGIKNHNREEILSRFFDSLAMSIE